jgi:hypothetical protein
MDSSLRRASLIFERVSLDREENTAGCPSTGSSSKIDDTTAPEGVASTVSDATLITRSLEVSDGEDTSSPSGSDMKVRTDARLHRCINDGLTAKPATAEDEIHTIPATKQTESR